MRGGPKLDNIMENEKERLLKESAAAGKRVREEAARFRADLPTLLTRYAGQWIIYKDGTVQGAFEDEDAAYAASVQKYGARSGALIAEVTEEANEPSPVTAGIYFGIFAT